MKKRVSVVQVLSNSDKLNPTMRFPLLNNNQNQVNQRVHSNKRKSASVEASWPTIRIYSDKTKAKPMVKISTASLTFIPT